MYRTELDGGPDAKKRRQYAPEKYVAPSIWPCKRRRTRQLAKTMTCMVRPPGIPAGSRLKAAFVWDFSVEFSRREIFPNPELRNAGSRSIDYVSGIVPPCP